jgi:hypothetical protein
MTVYKSAVFLYGVIISPKCQQKKRNLDRASSFVEIFNLVLKKTTCGEEVRAIGTSEIATKNITFV